MMIPDCFSLLPISEIQEQIKFIAQQEMIKMLHSSFHQSSTDLNKMRKPFLQTIEFYILISEHRQAYLLHWREMQIGEPTFTYRPLLAPPTFLSVKIPNEGTEV